MQSTKEQEEEEARAEQQFPRPSVEEYIACQFSSWYPLFSGSFLPTRRKGITISSRFFPVPDSFLSYLAEDGIRLPPNTKTSSCLACQSSSSSSSRKIRNNDGSSSSEDDDKNNNDWSDDSSSDNPNNLIFNDDHLQNLTNQITRALQDLGGSVFPKLNWSSPKDATWINEGTLRCSTPGDVYLLLKSSDFVSSDVDLTVSLHCPVQVVLRKWVHLYPSHEFRCFIRDKGLVAISQRRIDQHFDFLPRIQHDLLSLIREFLRQFVLPKFPLCHYVVDLYVDQQDRVWILDFNVWGTRTDSLLFDWEELLAWNTPQRDMEFRIVPNDKQVLSHPFHDSRAPLDTIHLASITGGNKDGFQAFMDLCKNQEVSDDDDSHDP